MIIFASKNCNFLVKYRPLYCKYSGKNMKPKNTPLPQEHLFRNRLEKIINNKHKLVVLSKLIDWQNFDQDWGKLFPSTSRCTSHTNTPELHGYIMKQPHRRRFLDLKTSENLEKPIRDGVLGERTPIVFMVTR